MDILATRVTALLIDRPDPRLALFAGSLLLLASSLLLLHFDAHTPLPVLLIVGTVLGISNGFNNLGLQAALYDTAQAKQMGAASVLLQTFRCTGAILSTALIGLVFASGAPNTRLHILAAIMAVVSALLVLASLSRHR